MILQRLYVWSDPADPSSIQDVFFRIGGATSGSATTSLVVNSANVILDDIWAWRADHGVGVGWTSNTACRTRRPGWRRPVSTAGRPSRWGTT